MNNPSKPEKRNGDRAADYGAQLVEGIPLKSRRLDLAGISTEALEGGSGPCMVLLHGPGELAAKWYRVLPDLLSRHHVIAPDLPGHGGSTVRKGGLEADQVLEWLDRLIDQTCASPPVLVGHVLGGSIAARFTIEHPGKIRQLVLVDSLGLAPFRPSPAFVLRMIHFMARPSVRTYDRFMRQCSADLDRLRAEMGTRWSALEAYSVTHTRMPEAKAAVRALMKNVGLPTIPAEDLARIAVPVALIWGRLDRANRVKIAAAASEKYGWPLHVIEDCADDPARDKPAAFLTALRAVLASAQQFEGVWTV